MFDLQFEKPLQEIIDIYNDGVDEALDGDDVDRLVKHLRNQLNLMQGNITNSEYRELERKAEY